MQFVKCFYFRPVVFGSDEPSTSATPSVPFVTVTAEDVAMPKKKEEKVKPMERKKQRYAPTKKTYKETNMYASNLLENRLLFKQD